MLPRLLQSLSLKNKSNPSEPSDSFNQMLNDHQMGLSGFLDQFSSSLGGTAADIVGHRNGGQSSVSPGGVSGFGLSLFPALGTGGAAPSAAAAAVAPAPTLVTSSGSNLEFNLVWDTSVANAPAAFQSAIIAAATFLTKTYTTLNASPTIINLAVGYGETHGTNIPLGALSSSSAEGDYHTYSELRSALQPVLGASGYAGVGNAPLPASDPTGQPSTAKDFFVSYAEEKALGLPIGTSGYQTAIDGWIGLSASNFLVKWDYSDTSLTKTGKMAARNTYDAVGQAVHEMTEVMGRISGLGTSLQPGTGATWTATDLFRFSASGTRAISSRTGYFSYDNGATNKGTFNSSTGDAGDWASSAYDSFGFGHAGYYAPVSSTDIVETALLGYTLTPDAISRLNSSPPSRVV
jgi:hypothetical protein